MLVAVDIGKYVDAKIVLFLKLRFLMLATAICIKERMNPRKQLNDMPRRYWKYLTERN